MSIKNGCTIVVVNGPAAKGDVNEIQLQDGSKLFFKLIRKSIDSGTLAGSGKKVEFDSRDGIMYLTEEGGNHWRPFIKFPDPTDLTTKGVGGRLHFTHFLDYVHTIERDLNMIPNSLLAFVLTLML